MGHIPPPYCPADALPPFSYTAPDPLVANEDEALAIHRNELDTDVVTENTRRGLVSTPLPSTDIPAVVNQTVWQAVHLTELRNAIDYMNNPTEMPPRVCPGNVIGPCPHDGGWCPTDTTGTITWTNPAPVSDQTVITANDINDVRNNLNLEHTSCICEQEACNYCSDCGHFYYTSYTVCSGDASCRCDDHQGPECACQQTVYVPHYSCATINRPAYSTWIPQTAPWSCMCGYTPPGQAWNTYTPPHSPGNNQNWGCMCNPFTWTT